MKRFLTKKKFEMNFNNTEIFFSTKRKLMLHFILECSFYMNIVNVWPKYSNNNPNNCQIRCMLRFIQKINFGI